jgi:tryptophan-rich sensory protein
MGNPNGCRVVLLLTPPLFLLFPVGVLIFALERISKALILEQTQRDWRSGSYKITVYGPTSTGSNNLTYTDVTFRTNEAPTLAILGICCLSLIVSAIGVFGI